MNLEIQDGNLDNILAQAEAEPVGAAPEGMDPVLWEQWKRWDMRPANDFIFQVQRGMKGCNVGLGNGLTNVNKYIYGTHAARYYLLGADSGIGKTTVADFMYVLKAWEDARRKKRRIKIFYCSFEVGKLDKTARWVSNYIFAHYGVRLPSDYLLGRIEGKLLTQEHLLMVQKAYQQVLEMMKDIVFVEDVIHPTKIFEDLIEAHFEKEGEVIRAPVPPEELAKNPRKKGYVKGYRPRDPDMMTILVIDHLALTGSEQRLDTKGVMDKMSKYMIVLRNIFHCTGVFIQQFSTDLMSWHRNQKKSAESIAPQRIDFGDSKATFRDADVVFGFTKPVAFDYDKYLGYQILRNKDTGEEGLGQCFVAKYLMKNRYGPSGRILPLFLDGVSGTVYDLPTDPNPLLLKPWIEKAQEIEALCQKFSPSLPSA
jgi:hypothetical protein